MKFSIRIHGSVSEIPPNPLAGSAKQWTGLGMELYGSTPCQRDVPNQ